MKLIISALFIIVASLLVAGCIGEGAEVHNCGTDTACFVEYMQNCSLAKVTIDEEFLDTHISGYMEIKEKGDDHCLVYARQDEGLFGITGEYTCRVYPQHITPTGFNIPQDEIEELCAGSLVDQIKNLDISDLI